MDRAVIGRKVGGIEYSSNSFSHDGLQYTKKNEFKPHQSRYWKIPTDQNAEFVAAMEDVLEVYARPYNKQFPVGTFCETC